MKKRLFSLLLTLAMMIAFMPEAVFAAGDGSGWSVYALNAAEILAYKQTSVSLTAFAAGTDKNALADLETGWSTKSGNTWSDPVFNETSVDPDDDTVTSTYNAGSAGEYKVVFREKSNPSISKEIVFTVTQLSWGIKQDANDGRYELTDPPAELNVELEGSSIPANPRYQWFTPTGLSPGTTNTCTASVCGSYLCNVTAGGVTLTAHWLVEYPDYPEAVEKNDILYMAVSNDAGRPTGNAAARQVFGEYDPDNPVDSPEGNLSGIVEIESSVSFNDGVTRTVTYLGNFINKKITGVVIPSTVTEIEHEAFLDTAMTQVTIPASVTEIGYNAFGYKSDGDDEVPVPGFVILGKTGSAAETYAKENGFTFVEREGGHTHSLIHESAKAATCGANGNIEYWTCSGCGKYFSDAEGNNEISAAGTVIKATGDHNYGEWTTTKAATEAAAGQQKRTCSKCGAVQTQAIAQLAPTLPKVKIAKPKAAKKAVTVKWKKVSKANLKKIKKVEIQVSTTSNFSTLAKTKQVSAKKTSCKIKGLKSKQKYYVRVRAYTSGHVSAWSAVKSVKTK